jgi:hypothetical protein
VVVDDLDLFGSWRCPDEADAKLIVDANAVLTCSIAPQRLESIARRDTKILELLGRVDVVELPSGNHPKILGAQPSGGGRIHTVEDIFGRPVMEALDHSDMITRLSCYGTPNGTGTACCPAEAGCSPLDLAWDGGRGAY